MGKKKDKKAEKSKKLEKDTSVDSLSDKRSSLNSVSEKNTSAGSVTKKKGLKEKCCDKYIKKGEHKRCKRCPCFDMLEDKRQKRFTSLDIEIEA